MKTPLYNAILQNDLDANGHDIIGLSGVSRSFDVKSYGATGDGTTDDTDAIDDALAAIPSTGGVLYFPSGQYKYAGTTLTLDRQITVMGDGGGVEASSLTDDPSLALSTIDFNSSTGTLFTVTANGCAFKNIQLRNTSATPSAGAGILVSSGGDRTLYENISVNGFYINIDVQAGWMQTWNSCYIIAPILYGLKLRHIAKPDYGDHSISNCQFLTAKSRAATSAIRIESGGGTKIVNTKFNMMAFMAFPWVNCIDLAIPTGVATSDLLVSNCSIESFTGSGIKGTTDAATSVYWNILITGNQFYPAIDGSPLAINLVATTAGDFNGVIITGNWANANSDQPMIKLTNAHNVLLNGNAHNGGFSATIEIGSGVTFADTIGSVPAGGTTGQSLKKLSNADYDVGWA